MKGREEPTLERAADATEDEGAPSWLTALPISDLGLSLSKAKFRDATHFCNALNPCACQVVLRLRAPVYVFKKIRF